ncbi:MAG: 2Fe-2S iron-sulfur cluster binding domain-containing protein [Lawsonibacter sp.]|jgi:carbon-monoxide dehydrogenase small subunit|uniref:(2Fe-2S)-binding protein n=1 Tax=Lawsonibacter sp. JLR.KK007 TaxID=3114293 RepID=UPI0021700835|nr:2Fe-2S iron-sulfur cluster binding domain-containing protein [Lawsonibacter sp.]MCI8989713.1 2Fe-2S iron-sulfur cluster binding domain-containing protein [Lawsonibacter sp.]MCI9267662.1 2Fe-2S iron-sulfur cluster binding domain-containing protein [Lawsonibacter sp.]
MELKLTLNGKPVRDSVDPDLLLLDFLRAHGCYSVKRGCETSNCGLCTVLLDGRPILSCSLLAVRADGRSVTTLEGLQEEAAEFTGFIAAQGADQCGFCNPGFVVNTIALLREIPDPTDDQIRAWLAGNLCRCSGYDGQLRGIRAFLDRRAPKGGPHGA